MSCLRVHARRLPWCRALYRTPHLRLFHAYTLRDGDANVTVNVGQHGVQVHAPSYGLSEPYELDYVWLRDACRAPTSVQASTQQKLFHTSDIPLLKDPSQLLEQVPRPVELVYTTEPELVVRFAREHAVENAFTRLVSPASVPEATAHESRFRLSYLTRQVHPAQYRAHHGDVLTLGQYWDAAMLRAHQRPETVAWDAIKANDESLLRMLTALLRDGFTFVHAMPTHPTGSDPGPTRALVAALAERIGELRHTFYGTLWDVQSIASSRNIAYTNVDLGLHMDLCYFQNPPRFQLLHMLRKRVQGGESMFVDSFRVAEQLWVEDREAFDILASTPVAFHYENAGEHYYYTHPTIELAHDVEAFAGPPHGASGMPRIVAVNYSPPFQAPLPLHAPGLRTRKEREAFYRAFEAFASRTMSPELMYTHALEEGECVVFDNRRVLHARRGFDWDANEASGEVGRWLKGAYPVACTAG
ncbi:heme o synthase [Malassezia brasiliensis]|uniref:Heme o synthase n=1 Tax=Malassezia brasiliensis TaxID=1821822 RepID=A0AAF0DRV1_9BASI|nr:heme o synthase [Malassezia brasiliensis]